MNSQQRTRTSTRKRKCDRFHSVPVSCVQVTSDRDARLLGHAIRVVPVRSDIPDRASGYDFFKGRSDGRIGQTATESPGAFVHGRQTFHIYTDSKGTHVFLTPSSVRRTDTAVLNAARVSKSVKVGSVQNIAATAP